MYTKIHRRKICSTLMGILILSLMLPYPSSLCADLCNDGDMAGSLRPAASGNISPLIFYSESKTADTPDSFLKVAEGAAQVTIVPKGVVAVTYTKDGKEITKFVGGGTEFDTAKGVVEDITEAHNEAISATPEYTSTDPKIDAVEGQTKAWHMTTQEIYGNLPKIDRPKYIPFDVDTLPDFNPSEDTKETELAKAIIKAQISRMLEYGRDKRFNNMGTNRVYTSFISGSGDTDKVGKIMELINEHMPDIKENALKIIKDMPDDASPNDIIIITYEGSGIKTHERYKNYHIFLIEKKVITDEKKIAAYAWNGIMDTALAAVSVDRNNPQDNVVNFLKELLENMLKRPVDAAVIRDFVSNDISVSQAAAIKLVLPPIKEIDFEKVEEVIRIIGEVAKYA